MDRLPLKLPERDLTLSLLDWGGEGPLALLAHANGFCGPTLGVVASLLRPHFRVIGYDARGHGHAQRPTAPGAFAWEEFIGDVEAVARAACARAGAPNVTLGVGHSFGGTAMLVAARRTPGLFDGIAGIDPVLLPPAAARAAHYAGQGPHPMAESARRRKSHFPSRDAVRARWRERGTFQDWDPRCLEAYLAHGFRDGADGGVEICCHPEVEAAVYEGGPALDVFELLPGLETPALWLFAERDSFPRVFVDQLAANVPAIEVEPVAAGHLMAMTAPDLVAERILARFAGSSRAATARSGCTSPG